MRWATPSGPIVRDGSGTVKLAWKRDPSVPAGRPALGSFDCVCGHTITGVPYGSADDHACHCGRV